MCKITDLMNSLKTTTAINRLKWETIEKTCDRDIENLRKLWQLCLEQGDRYKFIDLIEKLADYIERGNSEVEWAGELREEAIALIKENNKYFKVGEIIEYRGEKLIVSEVDGCWAKVLDENRRITCLHESDNFARLQNTSFGFIEKEEPIVAPNELMPIEEDVKPSVIRKVEARETIKQSVPKAPKERTVTANGKIGVGISQKAWDDYLLYLKLRDEAAGLRIQGKEHDHPYFKSHPSCQNRRYMDRESQYYIISRNEYEGDKSITDALFHLIFRKQSTYTSVKERFGEFPGNLIQKHSGEIIEYIQTLDTPFTGAYLVPHRDKKCQTKVEGWIKLLTLSDFEQMSEIPTAEKAYKFLSRFPGLGDFLAMQFVTELGWLNDTQYGGNEFVIPGNGCVRGMLKLGVSKKEQVRYLKKLVAANILKHETWKPLTLMDYQNTFCEFDKFTRYLGGYDNQGRTKMKRNRRPHREPITQFVLTEKLANDSYYQVK